MDDLFAILDRTGYRFLFQTWSALDKYYSINHTDMYFFITDAPLSELAKLFDCVDYRGTRETDASAIYNGIRCFFQCIDSLDHPPPRTYTIQNLYFDFVEEYFIDTAGMYQDLRARRLMTARPCSSSAGMIMDAALLVSRYNAGMHQDLDFEMPPAGNISTYEQRLFLSHLLASDNPGRGFALLRSSGFLSFYWPELESMTLVPQTKDHHPEGNVWDHVLEAFKYRKKKDPLLSLAILLHDIGKPVANGTRENPYQNHTDHGAFLARQFLKRLEFNNDFIADVVFLVKNHMMPEALPRLPLYRIEKLMSSPLFPTLLELYRADILSTFRGPDKYYEACRIYRSFMKARGNPFKTLHLGKRIVV